VAPPKKPKPAGGGKPSGGGSLLGGMARRAEKKLASKAITSDLGKKLLREYCVDETFDLLEGLRELAALDKTLHAKKGAWLENTILRLAVKVALLFQHQQLSAAEFGQVVANTDQLCLEVIRKYNAMASSEPPHSDPHDEDHRRTVEQVESLQAHLEELLTSFISPKNMDALREVCGFFADAQRLHRFLTEPTFHDQFFSVVKCLGTMYRRHVVEMPRVREGSERSMREGSERSERGERERLSCTKV